MITRISEIPNAWGWFGKKDRTAYCVYLKNELWAAYCYYNVATAVAGRLEAEFKRIETDNGETDL